jgi:hypothetical protein
MNGRRKAQSGGSLSHFLRRCQDVSAVVGPQVVDRLAAQFGGRLVPERHVAAD